MKLFKHRGDVILVNDDHSRHLRLIRSWGDSKKFSPATYTHNYNRDRFITELEPFNQSLEFDIVKVNTSLNHIINKSFVTVYGDTFYLHHKGSYSVYYLNKDEFGYLDIDDYIYKVKNISGSSSNVRYDKLILSGHIKN